MNYSIKNESCFGEFFRYTALSILGMIGVSCYILADTFFISKGLGANGLAALNLAIPIYNFIHGTGLMLGMGGATRFSVCVNRKKSEEKDRVYTNTLYLAALFSAVFVLLGLLLSKRLAYILGADENILELTNIYILWLTLFAPAFILNDVLLCFIRNDKNPRLSMAAMVTGSLANIVLDYIFIFPMDMGMFGAVFATGLSPVISIIVMSSHLIKRKNNFHFIKTPTDFNIIKTNLALGFPSLVAQLSSAVVMITFNAIILKLAGNTGIAAYGVIANISLVVVAVYTGIAQGAQPLISRFYGLSERGNAEMVLKYAMISMFVISCVIYALIFAFANPITAVFNSENNPKMQKIAVEGLKLYFISNVFAGYNIVLAVFFTSIEKALPAQVISVLRGFMLIVPLAFMLSALWKMTGVWLAYPVTEMLCALIGFVWYLCYNKKHGI